MRVRVGSWRLVAGEPGAFWDPRCGMLATRGTRAAAPVPWRLAANVRSPHALLTHFLLRRYTVRDNRGNQNATVDPQNPSYDSYIYMFNVCDDVEPDAFPAGPSWSTCKTTTGAVSTVLDSGPVSGTAQLAAMSEGSAAKRLPRTALSLAPPPLQASSSHRLAALNCSCWSLGFVRRAGDSARRRSAAPRQRSSTSTSRTKTAAPPTLSATASRPTWRPIPETRRGPLLSPRTPRAACRCATRVATSAAQTA